MMDCHPRVEMHAVRKEKKLENHLASFPNVLAITEYLLLANTVLPSSHPKDAPIVVKASSLPHNHTSPPTQTSPVWLRPLEQAGHLLPLLQQ